MNILDLIFEEDDNRGKPVPYIGLDEWKKKRKQSKKQETFDQSKMPKGERDWLVAQAEAKEKTRKEREENWEREAESSKSTAISELKKNISKKGGELRGNADRVDNDFYGKSLRDFAEKKKEGANGKAVVFSRKELEDILMSSDKAFIDAVSILSDLKLLHNTYHVTHSDERSKFTKEYIEWFLNMLSKGTSPETAIVNLSTTQKSDSKLKELNREYKEAEAGFNDALNEANKLDERKQKELSAVKKKAEEEIRKLSTRDADEYDKVFDIERELKLDREEPKYFEKQIDKYQSSVEKNNQVRKAQILFKLKQDIKQIEEKYENEENRLKNLRNKFIEDEKTIEKKIEEYTKSKQYYYYAIGPKYKELSQLLIKFDAEENPAKKAELGKKVKELTVKYNEEFNKTINAFSEKENQEIELVNKNRELADQIKKALKDGQTIKAQELKKEKEKIVKQINAIKDARETDEENGIYYKYTRNEGNKSLYTIKTFKYKNVGAFISELRNSIFLMNKNLLETLTRIVNILYFGFDEKGDDEDTSRRLSQEQLEKIKKNKEADERIHKKEVELGFDKHTKDIRAARQKKLNALKPLAVKILELQRATELSIKKIISGIDASIEQKKEVFSGLKQSDFGVFADDYDEKAEAEKTKKEKTNVDKLKKDVQNEFDKLIISKEEYDKSKNKEKINKLLNKAQVQKQPSEEEQKYNEIKTEIEVLRSISDSFQKINDDLQKMMIEYKTFDDGNKRKEKFKTVRNLALKYKKTLAKALGKDYITLTEKEEEIHKNILTDIGFLLKAIEKNRVDIENVYDVFDKFDDFVLDLNKEVDEKLEEKEKELKELPVPKKEKTSKENMSDVISNLSKINKLHKKIQRTKADIAKTRFYNSPSYEEIRRKIAKEMGKE